MKKATVPFTRIANDLFDISNELTPFELSCYMYLLRMTDGFHLRRKITIKHKKIKEATNIKKVSDIIKGLESKEWIKVDRKNGSTNTYEPLRFRIGSPKEPLPKKEDPLPKEVIPPSIISNGSRGAKESIKEIYKEKYSFDIFKEKYCTYNKTKFDEIEASQEWNKLDFKQQKIAIEVMTYQNNKWEKVDDDRKKYLPRASNWLKEKQYMIPDVYNSYKYKIIRKKEKERFNKEQLENDKNAYDGDYAKILSSWNK